MLPIAVVFFFPYTFACCFNSREGRYKAVLQRKRTGNLLVEQFLCNVLVLLEVVGVPIWPSCDKWPGIESMSVE